MLEDWCSAERFEGIAQDRLLTVIFITVPYREAVLATHQGVPDTARMELDEGQEYRKVCLAVGIICKVVMALGEVEILS